MEWQPIETAPKDGTSVIIALPTANQDGFIVGEAYFDLDPNEGGDWWWAGTNRADYHASPVRDLNYHDPTHWMPLPPPPENK